MSFAPFRLSLIVVIASFAATATSFATADALTSPSIPLPHVRGERADLRALIDQGVARSPSLRSLIDRLDRSDVVVYVRTRVFSSTMYEGRIGFASSASSVGRRYLIVELACVRTTAELLATLGHELQHAVEIAEAPAVRDAPTLAAHFERIGQRTSSERQSLTFETAAAREAGLRVRREVLLSMTGKVGPE